MCNFLLIITHFVKICVNLTTYCTFCAQILQFVWACENVVHNLRCLVKTNTQLTKILCHRRSWQLQWVWCLPGDFWYFFEIIILFWMEWKSNYYITLHIQNSPFPRPSQQGGSHASFGACWTLLKCIRGWVEGSIADKAFAQYAANSISRDILPSLFYSLT